MRNAALHVHAKYQNLIFLTANELHKIYYPMPPIHAHHIYIHARTAFQNVYITKVFFFYGYVYMMYTQYTSFGVHVAVFPLQLYTIKICNQQKIIAFYNQIIKFLKIAYDEIVFIKMLQMRMQ